ncbi:holo-[acyl-carrier-protein] synthase [Campylobacterota bacterium]|nr:holo-[acyl-carrier-protein] synthase [Campylobacterota bacterium]
MIGIDIVEVERVRRFYEKHGEDGLKRFLLPQEVERLPQIEQRKAESIAGLWAAKEAVGKALGCGICARLGFLDIAITKDALGAPHAQLGAHAAKLHGVSALAVSITHEKHYAAAVAMVR